ncbi:MAG: hypothetical protein ACR2N6_07665 [Miltoncostaeaceae bacterium]
MTEPSSSAPGGAQRLAAQRRRGVRSYRVRFPARDLRQGGKPAAKGEVPEARTLKGRQILVAVAGAALLVRQVARTDFGAHQEMAARRAWELLGGLLAQLEKSTPRMHEDLAERNQTIIDRMNESLADAEADSS